MNLPALFLAAALVAAPHIVAALDLTPTEGTRQLEGLKIPIVSFADGARRVTWQPPLKWHISGTAKKVALYPAQAAQAAMRLEVHPSKAEKGESVAENSADTLEDWVQQFLHQDAAEIILLGESASPFTVGGLGCREFTFTYLSQSRRFTTSVAVVDLNPSERLVMILTARTADFALLHDEAVASMFRWEWSE